MKYLFFGETKFAPLKWNKARDQPDLQQYYLLEKYIEEEKKKYLRESKYVMLCYKKN